MQPPKGKREEWLRETTHRLSLPSQKKATPGDKRRLTISVSLTDATSHLHVSFSHSSRSVYIVTLRLGVRVLQTAGQQGPPPAKVRVCSSGHGQWTGATHDLAISHTFPCTPLAARVVSAVAPTGDEQVDADVEAFYRARKAALGPASGGPA